MGLGDIEREEGEEDPAGCTADSVVERELSGREIFFRGMYSLGDKDTVNPLFVEPREFTKVDCSDFLTPGTRVPVDERGTEGYVVSVSEHARTAIVAAMEDVAARFPCFGDVKFVEVDLDRFGTVPYLN